MASHSDKIRILVADDDPIICDAYELFLTGPDALIGAEHPDGYDDPAGQPGLPLELVCCGQAEDAVDEVARSLEAGEPFAIAFLDVCMPPGKDGVWAAEQIRGLDAGIQIAIVTAHTDISPVEITARVPPAEKLLYLQKPFHPHEVTQLALSLGAKWRAERSLAESMARLATAQRIARFGHWEYEPQSHEIHWSREMGRLCGRPAEQDRGPLESLWEHVHAEDRDTVFRSIDRALETGQSERVEYRICPPDAETRFLQHEIVAIQPSPAEPPRLVGAALDLTERKQDEAQIRYLAFHDPLTGLLNRSFLSEHLPLVLKQAKRQNTFVSIVYIDLDHFKRINDTLGHAAGDELLQEVARRLRSCTRESDCITRSIADVESDPADPIARLGGDEFIVLLPDVRAPEDTAVVAERIRFELAEPFQIGDRQVHVSASIGISTFPRDGEDVESLLQKADAAMYHAKDAGRNEYQFYTEALNTMAVDRLAREEELRLALDRGDFVVHYQPRVRAADGTLAGAEALVRWQHVELGLVPPGEFIALAEETGLIVPLGYWLIRDVCQQLQRWRQEGHTPVPVSVNFSFRQFKDSQLAARLAEILEETGLDPALLEVEFTESSLMEDSQVTDEILTRLKSLGLRSAMDDFGTGYSSLSYLKRLPIDILKIDRYFVKEIDSSQTDRAIAKAIITMAHELQLQVTAEGVETEAQLGLLKRQQVDFIQGYLIARPMPADEFLDLWLSEPGRRDLTRSR